MRIRLRREGNSVLAFLMTVFTAVALAVATLPGCGDDASDDEDETESESDYSPNLSLD